MGHRDRRSAAYNRRTASAAATLFATIVAIAISPGTAEAAGPSCWDFWGMKCVDAFPLLPPAIREQIGVEYFECAAAHKEILDSVRNGITCPAYEVLNLQLCGAVMPVTRAFALSCNFPQEHPDVVWGGGPMPPPGPRKVITKEAIEHRNWRDMLGFDDGHTKYYSLDSKWLSNNPHRLPVPKEGDPRGWAPPPVAGTDPLAASGAFIYQESATAYGVEIGVTYRSDVTYSGPVR